MQIKCADGTIIDSQEDLQMEFREQFTLSVPRQVDMSIMDELPKWETRTFNDISLFFGGVLHLVVRPLGSRQSRLSGARLRETGKHEPVRFEPQPGRKCTLSTLPDTGRSRVLEVVQDSKWREPATPYLLKPPCGKWEG